MTRNTHNNEKIHLIDLPDGYIETNKPYRLLRPHPVYILAVHDHSREGPGLMTLSWIMPLEPGELTTIMVIDNKNYTTSLLEKNEYFTINITPCHMLKYAKYYGTKSGRYIDKALVTQIRYSYISTNPPIIVLDESPAFLILRKEEVLRRKKTKIIISRIIGSYIKTSSYDIESDTLRLKDSSCLHLYKHRFLSVEGRIIETYMTPWGIAMRSPWRNKK